MNPSSTPQDFRGVFLHSRGREAQWRPRALWLLGLGGSLLGGRSLHCPLLRGPAGEDAFPPQEPEPRVTPFAAGVFGALRKYVFSLRSG